MLWVALGSSAQAIAVVDVGDPLRPRVRRRVRPPFLAHDVAFSPSGRRVWVTAGRERRLAVLPAAGGGRAVLLGADAAPQHVSFGRGVAFVASGEGASVRVHDLADGRVRRTARVPYGSYNVQAGAGAVVTPSLARGTLTILDRAGRVRHEVEVARAAHDACLRALKGAPIGVISATNGYRVSVDHPEDARGTTPAHGPAPRFRHRPGHHRRARSTSPAPMTSTMRCAASSATRRAACSLDLRGLDFLDTTGLSRLVALRRRCRRTGRRLVLVRGSQAVQRLFAVTAMNEHFEVVRDPAELLATA